VNDRPRGAQPGNTNALRHGLYSARSSPELKAARRRARRVQPFDLTPEIHELRARLSVALEAQPDRLDLFLSAARHLAFLVATHYRLNPKAADDLDQTASNLLLTLARQLIPDRFDVDGQPLPV